MTTRQEHRVRVSRQPLIAFQRIQDTVRLETAVAVLDLALAYADCSYDDHGRPVMSGRKAREKLRAALVQRLEQDARR